MSEKHFLIESIGAFKDNPRWVALENSTLLQDEPTWIGVKHSSGIPSLFESLYYNRILNDEEKAKNINRTVVDHRGRS
jgi:hypothetical protein